MALLCGKGRFHRHDNSSVAVNRISTKYSRSGSAASADPDRPLLHCCIYWIPAAVHAAAYWAVQMSDALYRPSFTTVSWMFFTVTETGSEERRDSADRAGALPGFLPLIRSIAGLSCCVRLRLERLVDGHVLRLRPGCAGCLRAEASCPVTGGSLVTPRPAARRSPPADAIVGRVDAGDLVSTELGDLTVHPGPGPLSGVQSGGVELGQDLVAARVDDRCGHPS